MLSLVFILLVLVFVFDYVVNVVMVIVDFSSVRVVNDFDKEFWLNRNYTITYVGRQCTGIRCEALVIGYGYHIKCVIQWTLSCSG